MSNIIFRSIGDKNNKQSNTIEESNSNEVAESVTQLPLVTQSGKVDALCKIFVSLLLRERKKLLQKNNLRNLFPRIQP